MTETFAFDVERTAVSRITEVDFKNLPFGKLFTDHMLVAEYSKGQWSSVKIKPFGNLSLHPATSMIHYGQSIFEGLKAFRNEQDEIILFRPEANHERMNQSAERMCMPAVPKSIFIEGMKQLIDLDRQWVPNHAESSLYIRPFLFSTDPYLGVKPSENYLFMIILSPVGPYYSKPLHLKIETHFTRAARGGVGSVKAAGNYALSLYPARQAQKEGVDQLIWTDAKEHQYLEEAGTMNVMLVIDGKLITPPLTSTILPGVTRESIIHLAKENGIEVEERPIHVDEVCKAYDEGRLQEVFGVGTAATVAQVVELDYEDKNMKLPPVAEQKISSQLGEKLSRIKMGLDNDPYNWTVRF